MKNLVLIITMFAFTTSLFSQNNKTFCDPELQNEVDKISNMGGTYLMHFLISPEDLKMDDKSSKHCYIAHMVLLEGNTYRFYIKSSAKFPYEAILTLTEAVNQNFKPKVILHHKYNEPVAFDDFKIEKSGLYELNVSFKDNAKGCAVVLISFMDGKNISNAETVVDTSKVYTNVDDIAQFRGGNINDFRNYVAENFKADSAFMKGVSGKIIIQFVINTSGKVQNVEVLRSCGNQKLDNEGARVIKSSPTWTPAKIQGKCVKEQFVIPIIIN